MKMIKNNSFIGVLLLGISLNVYSMETFHKHKHYGWLNALGLTLLESAGLSLLYQPDFKFTDLPQDMRNEIIGFLTVAITATSLEKAAQTINALSRVNKELNQKINESVFCLDLIKHLAKKFECSDEQAAEALQIEGSKKRLELQSNFVAALSSSSKDKLELAIRNGADVNFTLRVVGTVPIINYPKDTVKKVEKSSYSTPLIIVLLQNEPTKDMYVKVLLDAGANPNIADGAGRTALDIINANKVPVSDDVMSEKSK